MATIGAINTHNFTGGWSRGKLGFGASLELYRLEFTIYQTGENNFYTLQGVQTRIVKKRPQKLLDNIFSFGLCLQEGFP